MFGFDEHAEHDSPEDVKAFEELPLEKKMVLYERGLVTHSYKLMVFFQHMIDDGRCWDKNFPYWEHYARMCASYLRRKLCHLHNVSIMPLDGWDGPSFLYELLWEGCDAWGRPPMDVDWGRPLRWKAVREQLIENYKIKQKRKEQGLPLAPPPLSKWQGCCGK